MQEQRKTAFAPMRPRIDTELADRLIRQAEEARKVAAESATLAATAAKVIKPDPAKKAAAPRVAPVRTEPFTVTLELEIVDDPEKLSPCWGYVRHSTLGVVLNRAHKPTRSAIASRDMSQLRWFVMLAIAQRVLAQHFREPQMKIVSRYLWKLVERPEGSWWDSLGVAFRLSKHTLSEGLEKIDLNVSGPQPFGQFVVG